MKPLEKAKANAGRVNYCDECESFVILNDAPYCKVDGKLIHPIMLVRGQGTGPAWNCKKRIKPVTNYERLIRKTPEELAEFLLNRDLDVVEKASKAAGFTYKVDREQCLVDVIDWLKQEAEG